MGAQASFSKGFTRLHAPLAARQPARPAADTSELKAAGGRAGLRAAAATLADAARRHRLQPGRGSPSGESPPGRAAGAGRGAAAGQQGAAAARRARPLAPGWPLSPRQRHHGVGGIRPDLAGMQVPAQLLG